MPAVQTAHKAFRSNKIAGMGGMGSSMKGLKGMKSLKSLVRFSLVFVIYMSRLRACGPVIPGIPRLTGDDPARYASGRYGDQVHYSDEILFLFVGGHTH